MAILAYTLVPSTLAFLGGPGQARGGPKLLDLALMLLFWLPLELGLGGRWIPRPAQGFLHTVAYGVAITLALTVFLCFRELKGMKYNLPGTARDFVFPLAGFVLVAPFLITLGLLLGFIQPFHVPEQLSWTRVLTTYAVILAGVALPEEILFRGLIQNWLMQKLGASNRTLLVAAVIFGAAHFNNGPGPLPNWRYAILATIAGLAYGKVFQASSSVFASAFLHALVNTVRHTFF